MQAANSKSSNRLQQSIHEKTPPIFTDCYTHDLIRKTLSLLSNDPLIELITAVLQEAGHGLSMTG